MKGEGEFEGPKAYEQFKELASVFYADGPGVLIHPVWQAANVYFVELALAQEPRREYVRYTFTFWEGYDGYQAYARQMVRPHKLPFPLHHPLARPQILQVVPAKGHLVLPHGERGCG